MSGSNWTFVVTDDQRQRVTEALTDKASQIVADASKMSGAAHRAALSHAKRYAEIASLFHPSSGTAEVPVCLPREHWLIVYGWLLASPGESFPVYVVDLIRAMERANDLGMGGWGVDR